MRSIVLSGFMATGKSTVGARLAARLGVSFVDTDELITAAAGQSIPELWKSEGEAAFRAREHEVVRSLLLDPTPRVIAFGGGTVTSRELRHLALERAVVVTLTARPETIARRAGDVSGRPNLVAPDPAVRVRHLLEQRAAIYAECHQTLQTDDVDADALVDAIVPLVQRDPIAVPLGERSYVVDVTFNAPERVTDAIARLAPSSLLVVTDAHVERARGKALEAALHPLTIPSTRVSLPPGEEQKVLPTVGTIWDAGLGAGIDRGALVVAFGGGVVGDLAGFAASTLLRGIDCIQIPTTLLSMVDSSVGGKTGFDHPVGKNVIGAFHQPRAVIVDLAHLATLSEREFACGLAEIVKIAAIADAPLLEALEALGPVSPHQLDGLLPIVRAAIAAKVRIVRDDERETGHLRVLLNLGHTLGHAIEAYGRFSRYLHGEAVALGTVLELEAGAKLGLTPPAYVERIRTLLKRFHLPTEIAAADLAASFRFVGSDKKRRGNRIRIPFASGPGESVVKDVTSDELRQAVLT
ncbi:3-dehydroquinate synthase [Pendulispora brunnea]|uniref:Multifunctional fusion protein n=1 Tax=Pendulispora brunnea TaxID=2905690 RepID=A0ABZ2K5L8_9BACT